MPRPAIGSTHGRLTIVGYESNGKHPRALVRCSCGTEKAVQIDNLARTHSCGCIKREMLAAKATHGLSQSSEYHAWAGMIDRCRRVGRHDFARYGGRGVRVCERWLESFPAFYADMGPRPSGKHSIDRINTDGDYEPSNCRWATAKEQRVNQRRQTLHTHHGVTGTLKDLALHFGMPYGAVSQRVRTMKWSVHDALTKPIQHRAL